MRKKKDEEKDGEEEEERRGDWNCDWVDVSIID